MRQHRQTETRIRERERLEHLDSRHRIQPRAAIALGQGHPEQSELPGLTKERQVEPFLAVVLGGLGLHLAIDECAQALRQQRVLIAGCEEIESPPGGRLAGFALWRGALGRGSACVHRCPAFLKPLGPLPEAASINFAGPGKVGLRGGPCDLPRA